MNVVKYAAQCCAALFLTSVFYVTPSHATIINLNGFFADPSITINATGTSATIAEDSNLVSVLLSNDPSLGDPNVIIPAANTFLSFSFSFFEGLGNDDAFSVSLFNADTQVTLADLFFDSNTTDDGMFDLSGFVGLTLGLQFELRSFDLLFDSTVSVSNLELQTNTTPVPAPATLALLTVGLLMLRRSTVIF